MKRWGYKGQGEEERQRSSRQSVKHLPCGKTDSQTALALPARQTKANVRMLQLHSQSLERFRNRASAKHAVDSIFMAAVPDIYWHAIDQHYRCGCEDSEKLAPVSIYPKLSGSLRA